MSIRGRKVVENEEIKLRMNWSQSISLEYSGRELQVGDMKYLARIYFTMQFNMKVASFATEAL